VSPCATVTVTTAVAEKLPEVAVTATSAGLGTAVGAVYTPALVIEPFEEPLTAHVTVAVELLGTLPIKSTVPPTDTLAIDG
jgi:hypothetical protein